MHYRITFHLFTVCRRHMVKGQKQATKSLLCVIHGKPRTAQIGHQREFVVCFFSRHTVYQQFSVVMDSILTKNITLSTFVGRNMNIHVYSLQIFSTCVIEIKTLGSDIIYLSTSGINYLGCAIADLFLHCTEFMVFFFHNYCGGVQFPKIFTSKFVSLPLDTCMEH